MGPKMQDLTKHFQSCCTEFFSGCVLNVNIYALCSVWERRRDAKEGGIGLGIHPTHFAPSLPFHTFLPSHACIHMLSSC